MFLARITGSLVATQKVESMVGQKLLIVEPLRVNEKDQSDLQPTGRLIVEPLRVNEKDQSDLQPTGRTFVAVDTVGSGEGEVVLCVQGSSARFTEGTKSLPVDAAIVGIIDRVQVGQNTVFSTDA